MIAPDGARARRDARRAVGRLLGDGCRGAARSSDSRGASSPPSSRRTSCCSSCGRPSTSRRSPGSRSPGSWRPSRSTCWRGAGATSSTRRRWARRCSPCSASGGRELGASSWWIGTPVLAAPVVILGLLVLLRTEKVRIVAVFLVIAVTVSVLRVSAQYQALGTRLPGLGDLLADPLVVAVPLPRGVHAVRAPHDAAPPLAAADHRGRRRRPRRLADPDRRDHPRPGARAARRQRRRVRLRLLAALGREALARLAHAISPRRSAQLTFRTHSPLAFVPGQYLELEVPHRHPDARGTRREFSIASAPEDLPELTVAFREAAGPARSRSRSYKKALAEVTPGADLAVTGVWGDFVLPKRTSSSRPHGGGRHRHHAVRLAAAA